MKNYLDIKIYFALLILTGCDDKASKSIVNTHQKVNYEIGFAVRNCEIFTDKRKKYVAFCDFKTNKKISVHKESGEKLFETSFKTIVAETGVKFHQFYPISLDSFALLSKYTNQIFIINQYGKVIYLKDYTSLLSRGIEINLPLKINSNVLVAGISYQPEARENKIPSLKSMINYYGKRHQFFKVFIDSTFYSKSNKSISFQLDFVKSRFVKEDELGLEETKFEIINGQIIYHSVFTDSIYLFNLNSELKQIKKIQSNYYSINTKAVKIVRALKNTRLNIDNTWSHSFIQDILYDKYRKVFYCIIRGPGDYYTRYMPFSVIVMDENLNNLCEQKFDGHVYLPFMHIGEKGLYIERIGKKNVTKRTYEIFRYE